MKSLLLLIILFPLVTKAYVLNRGPDKQYVRWGSASPSITLNLNTANNDGISSSEVLGIVNTSVDQWRLNSAANITLSTTSVTGLDGRNEIYFSNNGLYFTGSGIVGLTNVSYRESDGSIIEADILLNETINFEDSSTLLLRSPSPFFLGNVVSHELGHLLGLGHSQVLNSTMFYKLYNGQHSLEHDDISGAMAYYPHKANGMIKGNVVGSKELIGVIGTQVQAISAASGKVVSAALTEEDGSFVISGLELDDQYFLYYRPLHLLETLPEIYADSRKDFCNSGSSYRGAFYQSCYNRDEGYPMGVEVTSLSPVVDIGNISIQCGLKVPPDYFLSKNNLFQLDTIDDYGNVGNSFVGFFTKEQINSNTEDEIHVDLTDYTVASNDLYLDTKVVYRPFYSEVYLDMSVDFVSMPSKSFPEGKDVEGVVFDSDKTPKLDLHQRFWLNDLDNSENYFKFFIRPTSFLSYSSGTTLSRNSFYPELNTFQDDLKFYLFVATISKKNSDGTYTTVSKRKYRLSDNSSCPDAPRTYKVSANTYSQSASGRKLANTDDSDLPIGCGSIAYKNGDPPDGGLKNGMLAGLVICLLLSSWSQNALKDE